LNYSVFVTPEALRAIKELPGTYRQRVRRAIDALETNPRPPKSKKLAVARLQCEVRRLRFDRWRVVYAITESEGMVDVLAIRKRPPYDYGDLTRLLEDFPEA
jgi:mRNA interferase RelE/StbE